MLAIDCNSLISHIHICSRPLDVMSLCSALRRRPASPHPLLTTSPSVHLYTWPMCSSWSWTTMSTWHAPIVCLLVRELIHSGPGVRAHTLSLSGFFFFILRGPFSLFLPAHAPTVTCTKVSTPACYPTRAAHFFSTVIAPHHHLHAPPAEFVVNHHQHHQQHIFDILPHASVFTCNPESPCDSKLIASFCYV